MLCGPRSAEECVRQVQATTFAFAAMSENGSVVTWGNGNCGGDSSAVQHQIKSVRQVHASHFAFAAILEDGSVVTWGDRYCGGDNSAVQDQLKSFSSNCVEIGFVKRLELGCSPGYKLEKATLVDDQ